MMLDSNVADLDKEERPEVISLLPPYEGKTVLELGAGIGRFTGKLAKKAGQLIALDFIEGAIKKNESINGHHKNVKFTCADMTSPDLNFSPESVDLIFCNWILMYLFDEKKVGFEDDMGFQRFLDTVQYKCSGILRYERVFGQGFVSTGGLEITKEFVAMLDLQPGQKVLDVGCGIGGGDFYMAEKYDVHVVGIDLSINMISFALERAIGLKCAVEFEVDDCTKKTYPDGGKILISDYCKSAGPTSEELAGYIKQRGYDLHGVEAYGQMLRDADFHEVVAEDRTGQFIVVLQSWTLLGITHGVEWTVSRGVPLHLMQRQKRAHLLLSVILPIVEINSQLEDNIIVVLVLVAACLKIVIDEYLKMIFTISALENLVAGCILLVTFGTKANGGVESNK
ncbi:hypothetical protein K7X08_007144 [Anisodus acutangulus]|uniref:phosphoethanolamine N-methyltransferase n=1 Tax=Anisodus acutangulus TaxID=402998 RepID=A0A9Q1LC33_9SOLA|nr:hypothetical protein K7X08_007144 [Anisodus acutangulus]